MASAKLMIPKRSAPYYVLTANVTVHGKRVRRYGRFDFDPTVLKTHRQRENAAIEAALVFERAEQQKADDEKDGKNTPFRDVARAYIDSKKSMLDPSVRLEGDYEQHKNKANTTAGKETMLRRICEISPAFAEMPISKVNKRECEKFLDLLGEADVRSVKGYAVLKPNAKQYKKLSCPLQLSKALTKEWQTGFSRSNQQNLVAAVVVPPGNDAACVENRVRLVENWCGICYNPNICLPFGGGLYALQQIAHAAFFQRAV